VAIDIVAQSPLHGPSPEEVASVIAAAEAVVAAPPSTEDLIAHANAVFTYSDRKLKPAIVGKSRSKRPLCAGCAFGIRSETEPKYKDGLPLHPNCLKALEDPTFALKTSPRYLAAAVPLMSPQAIAAYETMDQEPDPDEEAEETEDQEPRPIEAPAPTGRRKKAS
jgi:hypothetical protein